MNTKINVTLPAIINLDDRAELRQWLAAAVRKIAGAQSETTLPSMASLRQVVKDATGFENLSVLTGSATVAQLVKAVNDITAYCEARSGETELPPPPAEIDITDEEDEVPEETIYPDEEEDEEIAELEKQAAKLAAAIAAAKSRPRASADAALRGEFEAFKADTVEEIHVVKNTVNECQITLDEIRDNMGPLTKVLDALKSTTATLPPRVIAAAKAAISGDRMLTAVLPFFVPGETQGNQIPCVASPPSFGKTFMSDEIANLYDSSFFHPFKDSLDEIDALVGALIPRSDGTFAVIDGPLVSAARAAMLGAKVLFVGDEVFNATKKTLEWMQSFLSPRVVMMSDGIRRRCFVIQTKHSLEDGTFEVITAPEENLNFLFCGNLRSNPPEALMSRCRLVRFDYEEKWAAETAVQRLHQYSGGLFDETAPATIAWAAKWANIMTGSRRLHSTMSVARPLCFRFLIGAVHHVCRQPDASLTKLSEYVIQWAPHQMAIQNSATQDTDADSRKECIDLVAAIK